MKASSMRLFWICLYLFIPTHYLHATDANELVFLNWTEYMAPGLVKRFENQYGIKIKRRHFHSDRERSEILIKSGGRQYDVVMAIGHDIPIYRRRGWLAPITEKQVPNLKHMHKVWVEKAFDGRADGFAVPFLWGSSGIIYRKDKIEGPVNSWKQLYQPEEKLRGKILMLRSEEELLGNGLKSLGFSFNSTGRAELKRLEKLLLHQKAWIGGYSTPVLSKESGFVTGEFWMGMVFNGDAQVLKELNPNLEFVIPNEGTGLWCDYLVVMRHSRKKRQAMQFINFLSQPENAALIAAHQRYATANRAAEKILPKSLLTNPMIYPDKKVLMNCELIASGLTLREQSQREILFSKIVD